MLYIINIDDCSFSLHGDAIGIAGLKVLSKKSIAAKAHEPVFNELQGRITIYNIENKQRVLDRTVLSQINLDGTVYVTSQALVMALNNIMAQCCCDEVAVTTTEEVTTTMEATTTGGAIPEGAIVTLDGDYIKTLDGDYIIVGTPIPEGALMTLEGDYIKTLNNEFITV